MLAAFVDQTLLRCASSCALPIGPVGMSGVGRGRDQTRPLDAKKSLDEVKPRRCQQKGPLALNRPAKSLVQLDSDFRSRLSKLTAGKALDRVFSVGKKGVQRELGILFRELTKSSGASGTRRSHFREFGKMVLINRINDSARDVAAATL